MNKYRCLMTLDKDMLFVIVWDSPDDKDVERRFARCWDGIASNSAFLAIVMSQLRVELQSAEEVSRFMGYQLAAFWHQTQPSRQQPCHNNSCV